MRLRFFDRYLKRKDTWSDQPTVQYWRMGTGDGRRVDDDRPFYGGEWAHADEWPLPETECTRYYTHGDGTLAREKSAVEDVYRRFDPSIRHGTNRPSVRVY